MKFDHKTNQIPKRNENLHENVTLTSQILKLYIFLLQNMFKISSPICLTTKNFSE